jgi:uncharacterized membrane protein YcaP (DUF421 family)
MFVEHEAADTVLRALILSSLAVFCVVAIVRVVGLRAFSKMTAFDFVVTVAIGSLLASASQAPSLSEFVQPTVAIASLLGVQYIVARLRRSSETFESIVQNSPVLLMSKGEIHHDALKATRVEEDDLIAKLREANVRDFSEVSAVVLETTGNISVLTGTQVNPDILKGVQRAA